MELFNDQGFSKTTMSQVAEEAEVSEQTVYNVFGDKIGLLHAAGMHAIETGVGNPEVDIIEALRAEPDPMERIRLAARATREIWEGGSFELEQMVHSPDVRDPRLIELADRALSHNLESTRTMAELLLPDSIRRPGLDLDDIAVVFTAIDTAATVSKLIKLGWTLEDYEHWLVRFLSLFLDLEPEARKPTPAQPETV
jgi:AcrR family transcriptional regulator